MGTYKRTQATTPVCTTLFLFVVALCACIACMPHTAYAAEAEAAHSAILQVADASADPANPKVIVNKSYEVGEATTWEALLNTAVDAGDLEGYTLTEGEYGGYINTVTIDGSPVGSDYANGYYWMNFINGDSNDAAIYSGNITTIVVEADKKYQLALTATDPNTYAPLIDWSKVEDPEDEKDDSAQAVTTEPSDEQEASQGEQAQTSTRTIDEETLFNNIATSYAGTGLLSNAMDLARACLLTTVDKEAVIESALQIATGETSGSIARAILALNANGIDPTAVPNGSETLDFVAALAHDAAAHDDAYISIPAFTLLAYESGPYTVPSDALKTKEELIAMLLASQNENGSYGYGDVDTTAMVVTALAPYRGQAEVSASIEKALAYLKSQQLSDGGFASTYGDTTKSNANSTATVVVMLCACGINPNTAWLSSSGVSPYANLLSFANGDLTAFSYDGGADNAYATEQGFLAMVAYKGLQKKGGEVYNVYIDDVCTVDNAAAGAGQGIQTQVPKTIQPQTAPAATTTARTSDSALPLQALVFLVLMSMAAMASSTRVLAVQGAKESAED